MDQDQTNTLPREAGLGYHACWNQSAKRKLRRLLRLITSIDRPTPSTVEIVKFWDQCLLKDPPFIHPADQPIMERYSRESVDVRKCDFDGFVKSERFGAFQDHRFHLSLVPVPYAGNLATADIFVLLLNPGFNLDR